MRSNQCQRRAAVGDSKCSLKHPQRLLLREVVWCSTRLVSLPPACSGLGSTENGCQATGRGPADIAMHCRDMVVLISTKRTLSQ